MELKSMICDETSKGTNENAEVIHRPGEELGEDGASLVVYNGPVVRLETVIQFSEKQGLDKTLIDLIK